MQENTSLLTEKELDYLNCDVPTIDGGRFALHAVRGFLIAFITAVFRALFMPSSDFSKSDSRLIQHIRLRKYTKFKMAVERKAAKTPQKGDEKILRKLNRTDFVLSEETFDPDEFTRKVYEDYMKTHTEG